MQQDEESKPVEGKTDQAQRSESEMSNDYDKNVPPENKASKSSHDIEEVFSTEWDVEDLQGTFPDTYRKMVIQLSECLEVTHVQKLSFLLDITLPPVKQEDSLFIDLMREAQKRMIVHYKDFSRLLKGLSEIASCDAIKKAISIVKLAEEERDRRPPKHWKQFCKWYENCRIKEGKESSGPQTANKEDITKYLESLFPHFSVNTIQKYFQDVQKYLNLTEEEKASVNMTLGGLRKDESCLLQHMRQTWNKWREPRQGDDGDY